MPNTDYRESSISELVRELIDALQKEALLFETFLETLEKQQQALVKNDIEELNRITDLQREKAVESRLLSQKRDEIIGILSSELDATENLTLSRLIESVSSGQARILGQLRETILDLNGRIMRVRSQNEMLINRSRENIMKTMELLCTLGGPESGYQSEGKPNRATVSVALDRRA